MEEYDWGKYYRGTEEAFIASGLIKPEWFPGKPGNPKSSVRIGLVNGEMKIIPYRSMSNRERSELRTINIWKTGKRFAAYISHPQEELNRREEEKRRQSLKKEVELLHSEKKQALDALPKSNEAFSAKRHQILRGILGPMFNHYFCRADGGYHYSLEVIEKARDLVADLIELAEEGEVYFDKTKYQYSLDDIEERAVDAHPEFSAFMKATLAIGKAAI